MKQIHVSEAAQMLNVSPATVRNWAKAGHITAAAVRPLMFLQRDVEDLCISIRENRFSRLRKRANKTASEEYTGIVGGNPRVRADLAYFNQVIREDAVSPEMAVFTATLFLLHHYGEARVPIHNQFIHFPAIAWKRDPVAGVMEGWYNRLASPVPMPRREAVQAFLRWHEVDDPLGLLHQGLVTVGQKSRMGAYFTPDEVIAGCLEDFPETPRFFLDPCCGTGRYLLRAAKRFRIPLENLYGFDADPSAVDLARINLLLAFPDSLYMPRVNCLDSLRDLATGRPDCQTNHLLGVFDAIATNPPWGGRGREMGGGDRGGKVRDGEPFSLFLEKSLKLLAPGGRLSFLLPESLLKVREHAGVRRTLLRETSIKKITLLGRIFPDIFTPIIRLNLEKRNPDSGSMLTVVGEGFSHESRQMRFLANPHLAFDVTVTPEDARLIDKIYACPHETLLGRAEWALGIVTGDNARQLLTEQVPGSEPVLRGRDIFPYVPGPALRYIVFKPRQFQQVAPERMFRAPEKLIYRFVSNRLIVAYDDSGRLTLNSANIVIPRLTGMTMRQALAFLNSRVFEYLFVKRFRTRKVLRGDLETFPFPFMPPELAAEVSQRVEVCLAGGQDKARAEEELNGLVESAFGLTREEAAYLEKSLASGAALM